MDGIAALQCKNASSLIALAEADAGISPTRWQRSTFPMEFQRKIEVVHEGVDLASVRPDPTARLTLPRGKVLAKTDEIVTFASRNLEPVRGYHVFLRSLPAILRARPEAQIVIAGGDGNSYSHAPPVGKTWKTHCLDEIVSDLDLSRVHFVGSLDRVSYLNMLRVSSAHVYLTYPFVLSWSLVEAMATECEIVASDTAPVREVIEDRRNGVLVPFHDRSALSQAVIDVLANSGASSKLGAAARKTVAERFEKGICVKQALRAIGVDARGRAAAVAA